MPPRLTLSFPFAVLLAGCSVSRSTPSASQSGIAIQGRVHGGQQPVVSARVYLFAAGTAAYGAPSTSLIADGSAGSDALGSYVLTGPDGLFNISAHYTCTAGRQLYLYTLGGNPGAGPNPAAAMMAAIGPCPSAPLPAILVDETTTVAFAYAAAGFALDPTHISSPGTPQALTGIANAFATATNLLGGFTTPAGNGSVPVAQLNTLANLLAACVNSAGAISGPSNPTTCFALFNNATQGDALPADTAAAAINIAHNPTSNILALFALQPADAAFSPHLAAPPNDFTLALAFTGGGLASSTAFNANVVDNIAVDAEGNIWKPNYDTNSLTELSPLGAPLSGLTGFTGGGLNHPANVAIDPTGSVWTANVGGNSVTKFTGGAAVAGSPFTAAGIDRPADIAVDGAGNLWVLNAASLAKLSSAGIPAPGSPFATNPLNAPIGLAILPSAAVWATDSNGNSIAAYTGTGAAAPGSPYTAQGLSYPYGIAFDAAENAWAADQGGLTRISSTAPAPPATFPSPPDPSSSPSPSTAPETSGPRTPATAPSSKPPTPAPSFPAPAASATDKPPFPRPSPSTLPETSGTPPTTTPQFTSWLEPPPPSSPPSPSPSAKTPQPPAPNLSP